MHRNEVVHKNIVSAPSSRKILLAANQSVLLPKTKPIYDSLLIHGFPKHFKSSLYVMMTDGAFNEETAIGGFGFIYGRYAQLPSFAGNNQCTATSAEETEGLAIKAGLRCAEVEGVTSLVVFTDSQLWVNALNGNVLGLSWEENALLNDVLAIAQRFSFCCFQKVPRNFVECAHLLAVDGCKFGPVYARNRCKCNQGSIYIPYSL